MPAENFRWGKEITQGQFLEFKIHPRTSQRLKRFIAIQTDIKLLLLQNENLPVPAKMAEPPGPPNPPGAEIGTSSSPGNLQRKKRYNSKKRNYMKKNLSRCKKK